MNKLICHAAIGATLLAACAWASATATVTYADTAKMTDVPRQDSDRKLMEQQFSDLFNELSSELPAGQQLNIQFLDIDLAGDVFPRVPVFNVRVTRGRGDYPRIQVRYSIEKDGTVLRSGERTLTDRSYQTSFNRYSNEMFFYEKQLLDDWFHKEIVAAR
jgi:hypothetical protein